MSRHQLGNLLNEQLGQVCSQALVVVHCWCHFAAVGSGQKFAYSSVGSNNGNEVVHNAQSFIHYLFVAVSSPDKAMHRLLLYHFRLHSDHLLGYHRCNQRGWSSHGWFSWRKPGHKRQPHKLLPLLTSGNMETHHLLMVSPGLWRFSSQRSLNDDLSVTVDGRKGQPQWGMGVTSHC